MGKIYEVDTVNWYYMNKNIYLSQSEQNVFNPLLSAKEWIITHDQVKNIFFQINDITLNKIISNLIRKGYLYQIKRGKYLIQEIPSEKPLIKDPYRLGLSLFEGYLAFSTALRIYNLIDYESFTVFIVTSNISRFKTVGQYTFKAVALGKKAAGIINYRNYYISSLEKTIYDCLIKPQFAGGYAEITKVIHRQKELDWNSLYKYIQKYSTTSMSQKIGYLLDLLKIETNTEIPTEILQNLKSKVKIRTKLIPTQKSIGKYNSEWKILDNLGKEKILSWWYYG